MKLAQFLAVIAALNIIALIYVHQHANLVRASYEIRRNETTFRELIEENQTLNGELLQLKSPEKMLNILAANDVELKMPGEIQVVRLVRPYPGSGQGEFYSGDQIGRGRQRNRLFAFLGLNTQAEAKTQNSRNPVLTDRAEAQSD